MLIVAQFTQGGGQPATGLALVDIDLYLYSRHKVTGAIANIWTPQPPTQEVGTGGQYTRDYAAADLANYDYFAWAEYTGVAVLDSDYSYQGGLPSECISRTLAVTYTQLKAAMSGNDIDILRGDTLELRIEKLGNISLRDKLWFTVKNDKDTADTGAWIQIEETAGLLYINGAAALTPANGSITVTDAITGKITVALAAVETAKLADMGNLYWDVQMLDTPTVTTLVRGRAVIVGDSTRATS